jgi:hypothetical protein
MAFTPLAEHRGWFTLLLALQSQIIAPFHKFPAIKKLEAEYDHSK